MRYEIIETSWHTPCGEQIIGIVAIRTNDENWKAYIGICNGDNAEIDAQMVASHGAKLTRRLAQAYFPDLDINKYMK